MSSINLKIQQDNFKIVNNNVLMKYLGDGSVVVIPSGIEEISHFAFQNEQCANITEVVIPSSVEEVNCPFSHCSGLEKITVDAKNPNYQTIDGHLYTKDGSVLVAYAPASKEDRFIIPEGVTNIEAFAFSNCSLEELVIPASVDKIENAALSRGIKHLCIDEGNTSYYENNGLLLTKDNKTVLRYFGNASTVEIPLGVTHIASGAFAECNCLEAIALSSSIIEIAEHSFYNCKKLQRLSLPTSLKSIRRNAFEGCSSLTEIEIPQGITELDGKMFGGCTSLASITIPESVTNIDVFVFKDCTSLASITFEGSIAQWNAISFGEWWNDDFSTTEVICSDGVVKLN